jgi:hypothetical protein
MLALHLETHERFRLKIPSFRLGRESIWVLAFNAFHSWILVAHDTLPPPVTISRAQEFRNVAPKHHDIIILQ